MDAFDELCEVLNNTRALKPSIERAGEALIASLQSGGKIMTCGNGGSAADALHLSEELIGKYHCPRRPLPALCLNADVTVLTCIGNDFGFEQIFARQVAALALSNDILVVFTTSGNSANILAAIATARNCGVRTILVGGKNGGRVRGLCDYELIVPSDNTARIQEIHTLILHTWLDQIDTVFTE
jgi:D-sedoheptulose 7-phosphate isomerase